MAEPPSLCVGTLTPVRQDWEAGPVEGDEVLGLVSLQHRKPEKVPLPFCFMGLPQKDDHLGSGLTLAVNLQKP